MLSGSCCHDRVTEDGGLLDPDVQGHSEKECDGIHFRTFVTTTGPVERWSLGAEETQDDPRLLPSGTCKMRLMPTTSGFCLFVLWEVRGSENLALQWLHLSCQ